MTRVEKLQYLLITQLKKQGVVELVLPDGINLKIGITEVDGKGNLIINQDDDYCWVTANRLDKSILIDSFNLGLSYGDDPSTIIFEDTNINDTGELFKTLDIV